MENYEQLKAVINSMQKDIEKFYNKKNKSASIRVRKNLQLIKSLAQDIRSDISKKRRESE